MHKTIMRVGLYCCMIQMAAVVKSTLGLDTQDIPPEVLDGVKFFLYTRDDLLNPIELKREINFTQETNSNLENTTVMYIHGFTECTRSKCSQEIKDAYMFCESYKIILVHWRKFGIFPYYSSSLRWLPIIGRYTALMIKFWEENGMISISKLHLIGKSLGAHMSGIIGEELAQLTTEKIGRITGLDPAGPKFECRESFDGMLNKEDANFVDIIHTDTRMFGIERPIGHVDFYVNGGKSQPGCVVDLTGCSHRRAREYYVESILNPYGFPAFRCENWQSLDSCEEQPSGIMGFGSHYEMEGIFLVKTKDSYPYAIQIDPHSKIVPCGISPNIRISFDETSTTQNIDYTTT